MDSWQPIIALVAAILIAYVFILWLGTIFWVYRDIRERTRDGWSHAISVALVALLTLPGLILYLMIRPRDTLLEAYERRLETEALIGDMPERRICPGCQRPARPDYLVCPHCRTGLRQACKSCHKPLELTWVACPYCAATGPQQMTMPAAPPIPSAAPQPSATSMGAEGAPPAPSRPSTGRTSP